jgi:MFS family permease
MSDNNNHPEDNKKGLVPLETEIGKKSDEEEELLEGDTDYEDIITLDDKFRKALFYLFCLEYCISSCDGGIAPQQYGHIKIDFQASGESRVGLFNSIDYIGRIIGALVMSLLINRINRKFFFSGCCFIKALTLIVPFFTPEFFTNLIARLLSGIPQTLLTSYGTLWVDQFAKHKSRSLMLPLLQLFALLGIVLGYGIGLISDFIFSKKNTYGWRLSFEIEGIMLGILGIIFLFYPNLYFSSSFYLNKDDDYKGKEKSIFQIAEERNKAQGENSFCKQFPKILCNKIFLFMSIGNTVAFFCMRVLQFHAEIFMEKVLKVEENLRFIFFILLVLAGPVIGIIICGIICKKNWWI